MKLFARKILHHEFAFMLVFMKYEFSLVYLQIFELRTDIPNPAYIAQVAPAKSTSENNIAKNSSNGVDMDLC